MNNFKSLINFVFTDANTSNGFNSITKVFDKNGAKFMDAGKKFSHWSAFGTLVSSKTEKKHTLDDSYLEVLPKVERNYFFKQFF